MMMGDIAEMMLGGTLCECCGLYIGKPIGFPRRCADCSPDKNPKKHKKPAKIKINKNKPKSACN
jgi:hypothetical protein